MLLQHIALVSEVASIDASDLARVSAAIQRQVAQDLAPIWEVSATIDPFPALEDVPAGYWPIIITADGLSHGDLGVHLDQNGQPTAWVEWSESWSITASHECLEMLVDPWGNRLISGRSLGDASTRVEYLLEVCDPCQDARYAYAVNDLLVSDFYTPSFFDPVARAGARYSLTGAIERPFQVLKGGYLSWHDLQTDEFWQIDGDGQQRNLGRLKLETSSLRQHVDALTEAHLRPTRLSRAEVQARVGQRRAHAKEAARLRAERLRAMVRRSG